MGFLDPLFISSVFGTLGLIGAYSLGVPLNWLYGEALFILGSIYLVWRDWNVYHKDEGQKKITSYKAYFFYFWTSLLIMLLATSMGMAGDLRLGQSGLKKIMDIISAIIFPASLYSFQVVNRSIPNNQKYVLTAGLMSPVILGGSKAAGLFTILWTIQRWINPSSNLFAFNKLTKLKFRIKPVIIVTGVLAGALVTIIRLSNIGLSDVIYYLTIRFSRDLDFYIYLGELDITSRLEIFNQSGGWIGNMLGNLSGYAYNIGSLVKATARDIDPNATGSNPRILGLIAAQFTNETILLISATLVVMLELWLISVKRLKMAKSSIENNATTFGFIIWTTLPLNLHRDVGTLKYSIIILISGYVITRLNPSK